jgi:hypothetical protein
MKNCIFCHRPVPDECYVMIKGCLSGREFKVGYDAEFACDECVATTREPPAPESTELVVGDIVLVGE